MKKPICLLLVIAILLCCVPVGVFAAGTSYYVAGVGALCGSNWNPAMQATR